MFIHNIDYKYEYQNINFLIQSDKSPFINTIMSQFSNSFYFKDKIRHINKCTDIVFLNNEYSKYYHVITIIMSKCKYIICGSGNANNVYQYLNCSWI